MYKSKIQYQPDDKDIIKDFPDMIRLMKQESEDICLLAVKLRPSLLKHIRKQTLSICLVAVAYNGLLLRHVRPKELLTPYLCRQAVKENGKALQFVPEELRTVYMCKLAINNNPAALEFVPQELQTEKLCKRALDKSWANHKHEIVEMIKDPILRIYITLTSEDENVRRVYR